MAFTSQIFFVFLGVVLMAYWSAGRLPAQTGRRTQNLILLIGSYLFYGWFEPWFCLLIGFSTVVDYLCGRWMARSPDTKKTALLLSLGCNLGLLGVFKYFDFFSASFAALGAKMGLELSPFMLGVGLPVGISFYTFQTLSYTIDIYRGHLEPRKSFIDFAVFVSFFPQLVAGPIERARTFLPQVEAVRRWDWDKARSAVHLIIGGYLKKLVIADNLAVYTDDIFLLSEPTTALLFVGALSFGFQVYADFSAYSDIARGTARLLGFELMLNFNSPFYSVNPSEFWRRWHISLSTWIRDYLYIPLGGSKGNNRVAFLRTAVIAMALSGLWHGATWAYVIWGVYHGVLLWGYHQLGFGGRWKPRTLPRYLVAWAIMFFFTQISWIMFRSHSLLWAWDSLTGGHFGLGGDHGRAAAYTLGLVLLYSLPLALLAFGESYGRQSAVVRGVVSGIALALIVVFARDGSEDFVYFRF